MQVLCLFALVAACNALVMPMDLVLKPNAAGQNWAVLVAGSNSWGNYRHQADVCHSYQVGQQEISHECAELNFFVLFLRVQYLFVR